MTDACFDPRNPDVIYAASYQRRRNVGLLIGGGPEAAIFKSKDGGATWTKLTNGIPSVDLGRIALAVSPQQPDVVYAVVTAAGNESGFFRSADAGATWVRQSSIPVGRPAILRRALRRPAQVRPALHHRQPHADSRKTAARRRGSCRGTSTWTITRSTSIPPTRTICSLAMTAGSTKLMTMAAPGGTSSTCRRRSSTSVALDNAVPFYNVYGGSQDNGTVGGPSRTIDRVGIRTSDWIAVGGGDGMQPRVDPEDPAIVYSHVAERRDHAARQTHECEPRRSGRESTIVRCACAGTGTHRSSSVRICTLACIWRAAGCSAATIAATTGSPVSPDLTRQIDRDTLPVMGRMWDTNAVTKNLFTTDLSVCSALSESPLREGLLFVGTDDGLVQISDDGGSNWVKIANFPGRAGDDDGVRPVRVAARREHASTPRSTIISAAISSRICSRAPIAAGRGRRSRRICRSGISSGASSKIR